MMKIFVLLFFASLFFQFSIQVSVKELGACFPNKYGNDAECYHRITGNKNKRYNYLDAIDACEDPDNMFAKSLNAHLPGPVDEEELLTLRRLLFWQNIDGPIYLQHPNDNAALKQIYTKYLRGGDINSRYPAYVYDWLTNRIQVSDGYDKILSLCQRKRTAKVFCQENFHLFPNSQACFAHFGSYQHDGKPNHQVRYYFNECIEKCKNQSSQVATFDSVEEERLLKQIGHITSRFSKKKEEHLLSIAPAFGSWIGIRLPASYETSWRADNNTKPVDAAYYMDGSNVKLSKDEFKSFWAAGEPSNGDGLSHISNILTGTEIAEHCVELFPHHKRGWNDEQCDKALEGCACRAMADRF